MNKLVVTLIIAFDSHDCESDKSNPKPSDLVELEINIDEKHKH